MEESGLKTGLCNSWITIFSVILLLIFNVGFVIKSIGGGWFYSFCSVMEFDRNLILKGEIWRIVTCHLVHWSPEHFYLDSIVFIFQGITFEKKIGRQYWKVLLLSALFISTALLFLRQDLFFYRGISGLINTQLVLGTGLFIFDKALGKGLRGIFVICFSIHMIKIIYETINRAPFFSTNLLGDMGLFTPVAHLSGVVVGFLFLSIYLSRLSGQAQPVFDPA